MISSSLKLMERRQLEKRIQEFAEDTIVISLRLSGSNVSNNLSKQIARSGTSSALNYAEALSAESDKDFLHKLKIVLKELRETHMALKIISNVQLIKDKELLNNLLLEHNELISILVCSTKTLSDRLSRNR